MLCLLLCTAGGIQLFIFLVTHHSSGIILRQGITILLLRVFHPESDIWDYGDSVQLPEIVCFVQVVWWRSFYLYWWQGF